MLNPAVDTLSMLSLKCAPRIFDLSSGMSNVSIRDQMVRAKMLVRDLLASGVPCKEILIVGAGVAGVGAAVEAAKRGVLVTVFDTANAPFSLQAASKQRFIGPYMYEWPALFHDCQDFPPHRWSKNAPLSSKNFPGIMGWTSSEPMGSDVFAGAMRGWLDNFIEHFPEYNHGAKQAPRFFMDANADATAAFVRNFRKNLCMKGTLSGREWRLNDEEQQREEQPPLTQADVQPDFILLAAGMGKEQLSFTAGATAPAVLADGGFWGNDDLQEAMPRRIGIFGGGDGALQDFLRALTGYDHPLQFMTHLNSDHKVCSLLENEHAFLLTIEQQNRLLATWTDNASVHRNLDRDCKTVARRLAAHVDMRRRVAQGVRNAPPGALDFVHLYIREDHFGKAYLLNRFLVYLIDFCCQYASNEFSGKRQFKLLFNHTGKQVDWPNGHSNPAQVRIHHNFLETQCEFDKVVVRFGILHGTVSGYNIIEEVDSHGTPQMLGLSSEGKATRTCLAQIPLPYFYTE